jgi:Fibrinogen beta and gamma chains, C-terminal globular domain
MIKATTLGGILGLVWLGACGSTNPDNSQLFGAPPAGAGAVGGSSAEAPAGAPSSDAGGTLARGGTASSPEEPSSPGAGAAGETTSTGGADGAAEGGETSTSGGTADAPPARGGAAAAGTAGIGGSSAAGAGGTAAGAGGTAAGAGGGGPVTASCATTCGPNGSCTTTAGAVRCVCQAGFVSEGMTCRRPRSCLELFRAQPTLPNGAYALQPLAASASFQSYCAMTAEGGGWTLVLNRGTEFVPTSMGVATELGYEARGTNLAYSTVLLEADVMLDVRMDAIVREGHTARAIITGVHTKTRGRTLRDLFTTGPNYLEAEDNSNLVLKSSIECQFSPTDLSPLFCDTPVIVFGDRDTSCNPGSPTFAIGGARSHSQRWDNCAGWPQATVVAGVQHLPNNIRVWIR